jgi:hypothetical protein
VVVKMGRCGTIPALVLALALLQCGGADRGRPEAPVTVEAGAGDPCTAATGLEFQNIADFEGDVAQCDPAIAPGVMAQCFYLNYDVANSPRACDATKDKPCALASGERASSDYCLSLDPSQGGHLTNSKMDGPNRCGTSARALHFRGVNIATCIDPDSNREGWGATLQVTFNWNPNGNASTPYDASAWEGISFWIRRGSQPTETAFLASVQDLYTAAPPLPTDGGPTYVAYCNTMAAAPDAEKCDPFGAAVLMTEEWRFVKLPFALLQQKGFGVPSPTGKVDTKDLLGLQFSFAAGNWDLWLDDIALYRQAER